MQQQQQSDQQLHIKNMIAYTYSPNWYRQQCFHFPKTDYTNGPKVYYASNYVLYHYDINSNIILNEQCFRSMAIKHNSKNQQISINPKNIKIQTISTVTVNNKQLIFVGINQPYVFVLDDNLHVIKIMRIEGTQDTVGINNLVSISKSDHKILVYCYCQQLHKLQLSYKQITVEDEEQKSSFQVQINSKKLIEQALTSTSRIKILKLLQVDSTPNDKQQLIVIITNKSQIIIHDVEMSVKYGVLNNQQLLLNNQFILSADIILQADIALNNDMQQQVEKQKSQVIINVAILSRTKNSLIYLSYRKLCVNINKPNMYIMNTHTDINSSKGNIKMQLKVGYPKAMLDKIKTNQKAAMTIKIIEDSVVIITGKLGEIFTIYINKIGDTNEIKTGNNNTQQILHIKPHSIQPHPQYLQICDDSKHYKQIYAIYLLNNNMYMLSTDQTLSIWQLIHKGIEKQHQVLIKSKSIVRYLTAQAKSIFYAQCDPKMMLVLLRDSVIRSCCPTLLLDSSLKQNNHKHYLNQHWKFTKKFKILKATAHIKQFGVIAMVTECQKILFYDLYEDRLMRIIEINSQINNNQNHPKNRQVINITFEYISLMPILQTITQLVCPNTIEPYHSKWQAIQLKTNVYYNRQESTDIGLLIQQSDRLVFLKCSIKQEQEHSKQYHYTNYILPRTHKIQRIHNTKLWNQESLLLTHVKNKILRLWVGCSSGQYLKQVKNIQNNQNHTIHIHQKNMSQKLKIGYSQINLKYSNSRCIFKLLESDNRKYLLVFQFKNKKLCIHRLSLRALHQNSQNQKEEAIMQQKDKLKYIQINTNDTNNIDKQYQWIEFDMPLCMQQVVLDYWSPQLIAYNQKEDYIIYLYYGDYVNNSKNQMTLNKNKPEILCFEMQSKIQTVSFYEKQCLAVGFKDQSIKIIKINYLRSKALFKNKTKKQIHPKYQQNNIHKSEKIAKQNQIKDNKIHVIKENKNELKIQKLNSLYHQNKQQEEKQEEELEEWIDCSDGEQQK